MHEREREREGEKEHVRKSERRESVSGCVCGGRGERTHEEERD